MRIDLNKWQRGLLLIAAAGILFTTLNQASLDGFEGIIWVVPVALAVALAFVAFASNTGRRPYRPELPNSGSIDTAKYTEAMATCSTKIFPLLPSPTAEYGNSESNLFDSRLMVESLLRVRSIVYAYVMVTITAIRLDANFAKSKDPQFLTESFYRIAKIGWLRRFGEDVSDFPSEQAKQDFTGEVAKALAIYQEVSDRMFRGHSEPFEPLFRYIQMDISAKPADLERKYGGITRELMKALKKQLA